MLIRIIRGCYGYNNGSFVRAKTPADPPFEVKDDEAERLISLGIAETADNGTDSDDNNAGIVDEGGDNDGENAGNTPDNGTDSADKNEETAEEDDIPEYGENSTNAELQAIAKEYGIEIQPRANKAELIAALDEFFGGAPDLKA